MPAQTGRITLGLTATSPAPRFPYVVGAVKIAYEDRDVAHSVITPDDDRDYFNVIGADDDLDSDSRLEIGENVTYRVELTVAEAAQFAAASNCRYVGLDTVDTVDAGMSMPAASSMRFMRADFARIDAYHGRDVLVAVVDGGTTAAVRSFLGATMVARKVFGPDDPGSKEYTSDHGSKVAACLIPFGGKFLDAVTVSNAGVNNGSDAAAAFRWAADNGAKVVNYSASGADPNPAYIDAIEYMQARGVQLFATAGNLNQNTIRWPAGYSTTYSNVFSTISFDENTGARSTFSNYDDTATGCAPGTQVLGLAPNGTPLLWDGTSAASPLAAQMCARGATGGRFTPAQVGAALKAHTRDTGQPDVEQGGGAYDLEAALTALGGFTGLPAQTLRRNLNPNPSFEVNTTGYLVEAVRFGVTATQIIRATSLATPFGTAYGSTNVTGSDVISPDEPDVEISLPSCEVIGGQAYTFSVHSRHAVPGPSLVLSVSWENASGATLGRARSDLQPLFYTVWARYHLTAVAPPGATKAVLWLLGVGFTGTTARSWRLDGFHYEQSATLKPYFDGSTSGAAWTGTAHNSISTIGVDPGTGGSTTPLQRPLVGWVTENVAGVKNELFGTFMARESWTDLSAGNYLADTAGLASFIAGNPNAAVMIGVPLIPHDSVSASGWNAMLDEVVAGTRDGVYTALGQKLAAHTPRTCYARMWWEFNSDSDGSINATKFKNAWARAIPLIRQAFAAAAPSKVLRIVFNSMPDRTTKESHYPGTTYVDLVTYDVYGKTFGTVTDTKVDALAEINGYLADLVAWGKSVGKPVGLDEWANWQTKPADGVATSRGFGDWPEYITRVFDWATAAGNNVNHLCYFNDDGGDVGITLADQPLSRQVFVTRTQQLQSGTTTGTPTSGSDTGAVLVVKAPTGVNTITNNRLFETVALAGLTLSGGAYRRTGVGPQLVKLERSNVGIAGDPTEADGTGLSITGVPGDIGTPTPGGGTGGGGGTGSADNPGDLLKVGLDQGFSKANIGIGFLSGDPLDRDGDGHVDFTLAEITNGIEVPGHFEMTSDKQRVRLTVPASAGTTSSNTANPRTEFRELKQAGDGSSSHPKAAWDPTKNDHKCFTRDRVIRAPAQKPQLVMIQTHDASDDTSMLRYHGGKLQCRIGDTVLSIGDITWNLNSDYDKGIQVTAGKVRFWFGPVGSPVVVYEGNFGWTTPQYYKWGNYLQANETNVDPDEYSVTEMTSCMCWHTGDPEPAVHLG